MSLSDLYSVLIMLLTRIRCSFGWLPDGMAQSELLIVRKHIDFVLKRSFILVEKSCANTTITLSLSLVYWKFSFFFANMSS